VQKAIECCFHIVQSKPNRHRHHGTWYAARNVPSSALLILAAVKAGGLIDYLVDWLDLISQAISSLAYWSSEAPDLACGVNILEKLAASLLEDGTLTSTVMGGDQAMLLR
jgi:hypothetical protein